MSMFDKKISIEANKKYDATGVSAEGITAEERAAIEKKNNKLLEIFKAYDRHGDGSMNKLDLAYAMDGFSKVADQNSDGKLSKKELEAYAEKFNKEHNLEGEKAVNGKDLKSFLKEINKATKGDQKLSAQDLIETDKQISKLREQAKAEAKAEAKRAREAEMAANARAAEALAAVEDAQKAEEQAKLKDLQTPKDYTVQNNERLDDILIRSLKNQGLEPTSENFAKAKAEFIENNPKALHGPKGKEYLYAGDVVKVAGNLEDKANADEIKGSYIKSQTEAKAKAEAEAKAKADAEAKVKAETEAKAKAEAEAKAKDERLNKSLEELSPANRAPNKGVLFYTSELEKKTLQNTELLEEIAKGDNPEFAAKALLAASKGTGTNDVLFEAVLNAGKDKEYFDNIDKELKKQGTILFTLAREEFHGTAGRTNSKNEHYKEYFNEHVGKTSSGEANKLGYKYAGGTSTYIDADNNKYNWNHKTLEFEKVEE